MAPGGSIYKKDGGIYWPIKKEKERAGRYYKWFKQDIVAATYAFDGDCSIKAGYWAQKHGQLIVDGLKGKKIAVKLDSYRKTAYFKTALTSYLIRTLHVNKHLAKIKPLASGAVKKAQR